MHYNALPLHITITPSLNSSLSALTAAQVKENNPNFSDLSDPNRPEKLGEQMSLLYDDQWTDATEALADLKLDDDAVVKTLLDILIVSLTSYI